MKNRNTFFSENGTEYYYAVEEFVTTFEADPGQNEPIETIEYIVLGDQIEEMEEGWEIEESLLGERQNSRAVLGRIKDDVKHSK